MNSRVKTARMNFVRKNIDPSTLKGTTYTPGVTVIGCCTVDEAMYGPKWWLTGDWEWRSAIFREWCEKYGVAYYSDCREDFFISKGIDKAVAEGKKFVVVEDLS